MIIDTHLHIWDPAHLDYGWLTPELGDLYRPFGLPEGHSAARAAGAEFTPGLTIDGAILVQAADSIAESQYLIDQAAQFRQDTGPWVRGIVGWLPLADPGATAEHLPWAAEYLVGIRHLTHDDPNPAFLTEPAVRASLRQVAAAGLTLDVPDSYPTQLAQIPELAAVVPDLTIVIDHLGKPPVGGDLEQWRTLISRAADHQNVVAKVSGLITSVAAGAQWNAETLAPVLDHALEAFGPNRLMFGSDWPISTSAGDYGANTHLLLEQLALLSGTEREAILAGTATRVYGL